MQQHNSTDSVRVEMKSIEVTEAVEVLWKETAQQLRGSERRQFMAKVVRQLGRGGQTWAQRELGWNRGTIRKGEREVSSGQPIQDAFAQRGRKPLEEKLLNLREQMRAIVEPETQADPRLESERLYTRISSVKVREALMERYGHRDEELPSREWIRQRLNQMGYRQKRVQKTKPQKVIAETPAIFAAVKEVNGRADSDPETLRISIDAKTSVKLGDYDRGGSHEC